MFGGLLTEMSNSMGSFIEQFVPETLRRSAEHDAMQRATDESERRIGQNVLFASHRDDDDADDDDMQMHNTGKLVAPLTHFALGMARHYRGKNAASLENPVVYAPPLHANATCHAHQLGHGAYLVNRRIDGLYRDNLNYITCLVDVEYSRPPNGTHRADVIWSRIHHELGSPTYENELIENDTAARADATYSHENNPLASLDPNDWVVYTRRSSAFMTVLSTILGRDALFSPEKYTLQAVSGTEVYFPTVVFLLGNLDAFISENATSISPSVINDSSDSTIITLDTTLIGDTAKDDTASDYYYAPVSINELEGGGGGRQENRPRSSQNPPASTYPRSRAIAASLPMQKDWVKLPAWTWSVFKSGYSVSVNDIKTVDGICSALSLVEMAILEQIALKDTSTEARTHQIRLAVGTLARIVNIPGPDAPRLHHNH